ncbi:MAG: hypothetical protein CL844_09280 [Crocinitomicaceae bacterium]|nr:hypothetical protein [Crocinitomicaceae bacterium]
MKLLFSLIFLYLLCLNRLMGQQIPQYSQWYLNQFANNPAHAGIKKCVDIHTLYRLQWVGFEGAPRSGFLSVSIPLSSKRKKYLSARQGTGFKFETDQIGQFNSNRLSIAYAAHFNFNEDERLSLGLYGGVFQLGYNPIGFETSEPDPYAMTDGSIILPDASFGAWFNSEKYYLGLTLKNLIPIQWQSIGINSRNRIHGSIAGGYQAKINNYLSLNTASIMRIPPTGPLSIDLNLLLNLQDIISFGLGYRNTDAIISLLNIKIKNQFSISYSFDYTISKVQIGSSNTHELSLRYTTCNKKKTSAVNCPLFE